MSNNKKEPCRKQGSDFENDKYYNTTSTEKFNGSDKKNKSKIQKIIDMVKSEVDLFHNSTNECFVTIKFKDHNRNWSINSKEFIHWLGVRIYEEYDLTLSDYNEKEVLKALSGFAKFKGPNEEVHLRVAKYEEGYVIDLCNKKWECVIINKFGWKISQNSPVKFCRNENMMSLPRPLENGKGDVNLLWNYSNIKEKDRIFMLAFMLDCFRPETHFPIAELIGPQGSGKSTTQEFIRELIDPSTNNLRAEARNRDDIFIGANKNWLVSYNNLSFLKQNIQDSFCILSTGGGYAKRKLYKDGSETVIDVTRPVIFNGITTLATSQDLTSRVLRFNLDELDKVKGNSLNQDFEKNKSIIFTGLLDIFSIVLNKISKINFEGLQRMADYAILGEALSQIYGNQAGFFIEEYNKKIKTASIDSLDDSTVCVAIREFLEKEVTINKLPIKDLLKKLKPFKNSLKWPDTPKALSNILRRHMPGLKAAGIKVTYHTRTNKGVPVSIEKIKECTQRTLSSQPINYSNDKSERSEHGERCFDEKKHYL